MKMKRLGSPRQTRKRYSHSPAPASILCIFWGTLFSLQLLVIHSFAPFLQIRPNQLVLSRNNFYFAANPRDEAGADDDDFLEDPVELPLSGMEDALSEEELKELTVSQLKQQLRLRGLKVSGKKKDLIDRLLKKPSSQSTSAEKQTKEGGKSFADVTEYLDEEDQGKQVKTWKNNDVIDAEFVNEYEKETSENDNKAEVWGSEARIVDDYEGRKLVVDCLSQLVVEFKGSNQTYVSALVVASRDALKPFLAGGGTNAKNQTQTEQRLREIQLKREKENQLPRRMTDDVGLDEGDEEGLYANIIARDESDWGKYTVTGAQLSAAEVQGVLLLSDVYGAFSPDMQALAEKIAFECQPVVVMVPDLFRGNPWKEENETPGRTAKGQTYEQWRATHSDLRVSVDIRAAAANLRERYGVSSVAVWGTCYGGGRALEVAAGYIPDGKIHDIDGSVGPPLVNPMAAIAWYPTRYDASALFGKDRLVAKDKDAPELAVMAVFAGNDNIPGATADDAKHLKELLSDDHRVKDSLVKVFPGQDHGFAHIGLAANLNAEEDTEFERFVDGEFGGAGRLASDSGEADVACLLSTAFMETYTRVFLPTTGSLIADDGWSSDLDMKDLSDANSRDIRREIEESLANLDDLELDEQSTDLREQMKQLVERLKQAEEEEADPGANKIEDDDDETTVYKKIRALEGKLF